MKYFTIMALVLLLPAPLRADPFGDAREKYSNSLQRIELTYQVAMDEEAQAYLKTLTRWAATLQAEGQLDALLSAQKEIDRFKQSRTLPEEPGPETSKTILKAREEFLAGESAADLKRSEDKAALMSSYWKHLSLIKKQLILEDRIDEAVQVNAEMTEINSQWEPLQKALLDRKKEMAQELEAKRSPQTFPPALMNGLVGYYQFDRKEDKTITDSSSKRNHGKSNRVEWVPRGHKGGGIRIDFHDQWIELPKKMLQGVEALTLSVWAKVPEYQGSLYPSFIGSYTGSTAQNIGIGIQQNTRRLYLEVDTDRKNYWWAGVIELPWDTWFHAVLVYDGQFFREYLNGEPGLAREAPGKPRDVAGLYIGRHGPDYNPSDSYIGELDTVMIYNRALSEAEVQQLYRSQK